jgi:hypothetical protein
VNASRKWQDDRGWAFTEVVKGVRVVCVTFDSRDDAPASDGLFSQPDLAPHKFRLETGGLPQAFDVGELSHDATPLMPSFSSVADTVATTTAAGS